MKLKILNLIFLHKEEVFWVFIEKKKKKKIDLDATYFKLHLTIVKFPTLESSSEWDVGFTYVLYNIFRDIYLCWKVATLKLKGNIYFLITLYAQSNKNIFCL